MIEHLAWSTLPKDRKSAEELFLVTLMLNPHNESARQGLLMVRRVPHLGILWNMLRGWPKWLGPSIVAGLLSFDQGLKLVPIVFTIFWLNRAYSNLVLSLTSSRKLLTEREKLEGPLTLGLFLLGVLIWHQFDQACGLLICLLSFVLEQMFDPSLESPTVENQVPLILGSYLTSWFWNPWCWALGYAISWHLSSKAPPLPDA